MRKRIWAKYPMYNYGTQGGVATVLLRSGNQDSI